MQLSFIFLIVYLFILMFSIFASANFLFKRWLACLCSGLILLFYVYLDRRIQGFNTIQNMTDYVFYHFDKLFDILKVYDNDRLLVSQGIYLFIVFLIIYIIFRMIFSFIKVNFTCESNYQLSWPKLLNGFMFLVCGFLFSTYFMSTFAPIFTIKYGFMEPIIKSLGVLIR